MNTINNLNFLKGMGVGLVAGGVISMVATPKKSHSKNVVGKCLKGMGEIIENVSDAMGV